MPAARIINVTALEDSTGSLMARIRGADGAYLTQAATSSIAYIEKDEDDESTIASGSLTVSTTIYDTLQTDARWSQDLLGYNFRYDIPPAQLPTGAKTYRYEFTITPAAGHAFKIAFRVTTLNMIGS